MGHVLHKTIASNWKIFWENYNECLHCPGVHPQPVAAGADLRPRAAWRSATIRSGARTPRTRTPSTRVDCATAPQPGLWTAGPPAIPFPGLSDADRKAGLHLHDQPAVGISRGTRRLRSGGAPAAPGTRELTELRVEYLFSPQTLADPRLRSAQRGGFHQPRHDGGRRGMRTQSAGLAAAAARARRGHAGGVRHTTIP